MDMQFYVFLFFIWLLSYLFLRSVVPNRSRGNANGGCKTPVLPPSPLALPLLGPLAHQSLDSLAKRYGPILHLHLASLGSSVVVSSPALAREFLKSHDLTFACRPRIVARDYMGEDSLSFTFLPYGAQWKLLKKILMTELFSPRKIEKMARIRQEEMKRFLESLLQKSRAGERADLEDMLTVLTNNIICGMTISVTGDMSEAADEYRKVVQEHIELSSKLNTVHLLIGSLARLDLFGYGKRLRKANKRFLAMVDKILEEHEQKQQRLKQGRKTTKRVEEEGESVDEEEEDLVDVLLKISNDDGAEVKLTRHNIRTCLLVFGFSSSSVV